MTPHDLIEDTIEVEPGLAPARAPGARPRQRSVARAERPRLARFVAASMRRRRHNVFYSRFVTLMKVVFPAAAVALAALVLFWPQFNPLSGRFRLKPVQVSIDDLANLRMVSPRVLGTDKKNEPYQVTATLATQAAGGSDVTDLTSPKGDITLNNGSWLSMTAKQGQYNKTTRVLDLWDHVNVFQDSGYELHTERAQANLAEGSVAGNDPVEGHGPDGTMQGQGFRVYDKGGRILVTGKSRLVLYPQQQQQAEASPPPRSKPPSKPQHGPGPKSK
jgi:lipopolysaccharide export system protein LptC